jgi:hypothetical protein
MTLRPLPQPDANHWCSCTCSIARPRRRVCCLISSLPPGALVAISPGYSKPSARRALARVVRELIDYWARRHSWSLLAWLSLRVRSPHCDHPGPRLAIQQRLNALTLTEEERSRISATGLTIPLRAKYRATPATWRREMNRDHASGSPYRNGADDALWAAAVAAGNRLHPPKRSPDQVENEKSYGGGTKLPRPKFREPRRRTRASS